MLKAVKYTCHNGAAPGRDGSGSSRRAWEEDHRISFLQYPRLSLNCSQPVKSEHSRISSWRTQLIPLYVILILNIFMTPVLGAFISFQNCLSESYQQNLPQALQFVPLYVDASFNTSDPAHNLQITIYGNVTGSYRQVTLPPANDSAWTNPNITDGKIENLTEPFTKYTTLFNKVNVLTYEPWSENVNFCNQIVNGTCPLAPRFFADPNNPYDFPAFSMSNNFYASYAFTSFTATSIIIDGDTFATTLGCISAEVTPDLGSSLSGILTFIPLVVLICVGFATAFAGIFSPWGTTDPFKWTTNYGRDADLLRLVTPGFSDCLQYLQFVVLTGGLTLSYPGYYQPVVSKVSWSALLFNESFVSKGGSQSLVDGIYAVNGTYGLDNLGQLVGIGNKDDIWAGMAVWLLVILGAIMAMIQLGFLFRWTYRRISGTREEDLRAKNMPFSVGNVIRIVFSYFLLPIVALSMFQLVVAASSPAYTVALASVMLLAVVGFAAWLLYLVASTRPRSFLFDDLPTVLLYGPLYNTYSDDAAPFALVPVLLTFVRGVAIGAVQPSGIAQIVLLAICEVITILALHAFRPFHSPTSMNAYHTIFAAVRFASIVLMVAFAPSLGVTDGPKGWIGYTILLLHAIVLVFGFFLNAVQTIVEVAARLAGVGGDEHGAARGGFVKVFGMRQLSRRLPRREAGSRQSQLSSSAMLVSDRKSVQMTNGGIVRSPSAGSTGVLLNNRPRSVGLDSSNFDPNATAPPHALESRASTYTPTTPGEASAFSFLPSNAGAAGTTNNRDQGTILNLATAEAADPYYRPPRLRRPTLDAPSPGAKSRGSWHSGEWANKRWSEPDPMSPIEGPTEAFEGPSISGRGTPIPNFASQPIDANLNESRRSKTDYTTREVDFYYGVRGPALNANVPSRRIRTGPADPTGPVSSATGWLKGFFGGKTKEKGKGFEVVRSSRMPPGMVARNRSGEESPPEGIPIAATGAIRRDLDDDEPQAVGRDIQSEQPILDHNNNDLGSEVEGDEEEFEMTRISDIPPSLPDLDIGNGIELPSRIPSKASAQHVARGLVGSSSVTEDDLEIPRKSSRRRSQNQPLPAQAVHQLANVNSTSASAPIAQPADLYDPELPGLRGGSATASARLPFDSTNEHNRQSTISTSSSILPVETQHPPSALGSLSADIRNDRPTSIGHVNNHSIHTINPGPPRGVDMLGSSAEIVDETPASRGPPSHKNEA